LGIVFSPASLLRASELTLMDWFTMLTFAAGTTAPELWRMTPVTVPFGAQARESRWLRGEHDIHKSRYDSYIRQHGFRLQYP
jgi:hypothetical protein